MKVLWFQLIHKDFTQIGDNMCFNKPFIGSQYSGADLSFTDVGLESGSEYNYQLSAKNESGFGDIAYLNDVLTLPGKTIESRLGGV